MFLDCVIHLILTFPDNPICFSCVLFYPEEEKRVTSGWVSSAIVIGKLTGRVKDELIRTAPTMVLCFLQAPLTKESMSITSLSSRGNTLWRATRKSPKVGRKQCCSHSEGCKRKSATVNETQPPTPEIEAESYPRWSHIVDVTPLKGRTHMGN
ncbi:hypothetical protein J1N35_019658 [Gossypium stocksii]|uniref:Uncharacterized protein n=1 Tax=Gossypium stocksii TaxID=47602 RepID=A0A9D3VRE3_9ROSI|nr:hypothetical protein J1N35_019658 [Gossypium stocksii]